MPPSIRPALAALDGAQIPGGCDQCDAYQTVHVTEYGGNIHIHHDEWCPTWNSMGKHCPCGLKSYHSHEATP